MSGSEGILAASFASQSITSMASAYASSQAYQVQGDYQKMMSELNSEIADFQAEDALRRGEKEIELYESQIKKIIADQQVGFAAQGIEIDTGSAAIVQQDTRYLAELDKLQIKNNAYREAFGYRIEAIRQTAQGQFAQIGANLSSRNTLLSGGVQALDYGIQGFYASQGGFNRRIS